MKYTIRAIKYFIYYFILLAVIMCILILIKAVPSHIEDMFRNGYKSVGQIAILFAAISAIQPKFSYVKRNANIGGAYGEIRQGLIDYMAEKGYVLETENGENMTFRVKSFVYKFLRMFEDRLTFTRAFGGFEIEGSNRDMTRILRGLEYKFRKENNDTDIDNPGNSKDDIQ